MSWIRTISEDDATGRLAELYAAHTDAASGAVDNILKIHSLAPGGLEAHLALYLHVMRGTKTLRKADREMIAVVVSQLNGCHY